MLIMVVKLTLAHFIEDIRIQRCFEDFTTLKPGAVSYCAQYSVGSMCMYVQYTLSLVLTIILVVKKMRLVNF
jgi:hypothetical protein